MPEKNYLSDSGRINLNPTPQDLVPENKSQSNEIVPVESEKVSEEIVNQPQTVKEVIIPTTKTEVYAAPIAEDIEDELQSDTTENLRKISDIPPKTLAIFAIVAGIIIMIIGYTAYRYFSSDNSDTSRDTPIAEVQIDEDSDTTDLNANGRITSGAFTMREGEWEEVNPDDYFGIVREDPGNVQVSPQISQVPPAVQNSNPVITNDQTTVSSAIINSTQETGKWTANDYSKGQIKAGTYKVIRGDTLWEIAEAVYGNGSDWHKIADANHVPYLANGNPLIVTGQSINIPI